MSFTGNKTIGLGNHFSEVLKSSGFQTISYHYDLLFFFLFNEISCGNHICLFLMNEWSSCSPLESIILCCFPNHNTPPVLWTFIMLCNSMGDVLTKSPRKKKNNPQFVAFADLHGTNIPTMGHFRLEQGITEL